MAAPLVWLHVVTDFASAGLTHTYQQGLYPYLNLRFRPRVLTYLWPLKQTLMIETGLLLFMGAGFGLTTFYSGESNSFYSRLVYQLDCDESTAITGHGNGS